MRKGQQQLTETGNCEGYNDDDGTINDDNEGYFGVCGILYEEETDEIEKWIASDVCGMWYHWECASIVEEPESYICVSTNNDLVFLHLHLKNLRLIGRGYEGERTGIRPEILPGPRALRLRVWSDPHLIPFLTHMGVGGVKL